MNSKINKVNCDFEVEEKLEKPIVTINKKDSKISFYSQNELDLYIENDFNKKYRKLLYLIMSVTEDEESTDSDIELLYLKIDKLKELLVLKYFKYINQLTLNKYLKMLMLLEEKLNVPRKQRGR